MDDAGVARSGRFLALVAVVVVSKAALAAVVSVMRVTRLIGMSPILSR
jgi:hypothetical protein